MALRRRFKEAFQRARWVSCKMYFRYPRCLCVLDESCQDAWAHPFPFPHPSLLQAPFPLCPAPLCCVLPPPLTPPLLFCMPR